MKKLLNFDFYNYISTKIVYYFEKTITFDKLEREKLFLGVFTLVNNIIKTLFICCVSLILGCLKETIFMILILFSLRLTACGLHAKSNLSCTLISLTTYCGSSLLSSNVPIDKSIAFIICIFLTILLYKYSPADTANRPILYSTTRKKLKLQTLFTSIILLIINIIFQNTKLINLTMFAMLAQVISILPITYKLLKRSYNNYETYEN